MTRQHEAAPTFSPRRVSAMMLRYWYLLRSSWPRLLDLVYWPTVQMVTWGFLQYYIANNAGFFARAGGICPHVVGPAEIIGCVEVELHIAGRISLCLRDHAGALLPLPGSQHIAG